MGQLGHWDFCIPILHFTYFTKKQKIKIGIKIAIIFFVFLPAKFAVKN